MAWCRVPPTRRSSRIRGGLSTVGPSLRRKQAPPVRAATDSTPKRALQLSRPRVAVKRIAHHIVRALVVSNRWLAGQRLCAAERVCSAAL